MLKILTKILVYISRKDEFSQSCFLCNEFSNEFSQLIAIMILIALFNKAKGFVVKQVSGRSCELRTTSLTEKRESF